MTLSTDAAADVASLVDALSGRVVVAVVGAGCSTESGIPDYRGPETRRRARNPLQYRQFVDDPSARQRYWARALVGWRRVASAQPNAAHHALADLERQIPWAGTITQNVDGLHQAAGSRHVVELHGALRRVRCMGCDRVTTRRALQDRLEGLNPGWATRAAELAPDGDAEVSDVHGFVVAPCAVCGGALKPDVVFFGENVPRERVETASGMLTAAGALLVVGSSLTVFSGYRFVKRAHERGLPIGIVNLGPTRADTLATATVDARAGTVLPMLVRRLSH